MEINFEKPLVPNFVRTSKGTLSLADLSEEELTQYAEIWCERLKERREEQLNSKELGEKY
jgi:hypothetical protein